MSPRRARIGADLFTAAVATSVGVALAGLTWRLLGDPGQRLGATPAAVRPAPPPDIAALVALSPFGEAAPVATTATDGAMVLKGILLARPRAASSALISVGGAAPVAFYEGQALAGGTIEAIEADRVVIAGGGGRRLLAFADRGGGGTPAAAGPSTAPTGPATPSAPPPPPSASPQSLLAGLGASPQADGLHVGTPSGPMRSAGVQPGDVVARVNGMAPAALMADPAALQAALASGTARIDIVRGGQPLTLSVPLR